MLTTALESVRKQRSCDIEVIVVDGGSIDGSQQVASAAGARLVEAPGSKIYEAINLGLLTMTGELFMLLNSDDVLPEGAVETLLEHFATSPSAEAVQGRAPIEEWNGEHWVEISDGRPPQSRSAFRSFLLGPTNINAAMFKSTLWRRLGPFDQRYAISADREWLARAYTSGVAMTLIDKPTYIYRAHDGSLTIGKKKLATQKWVAEHLEFATSYLRRQDLPGSIRSDLRAFLAKETVHAAYLAIRNGEIEQAVATLLASSRHHPTWPISAIAPLLGVLSRRLNQRPPKETPSGEVSSL